MVESWRGGVRVRARSGAGRAYVCPCTPLALLGGVRLPGCRHPSGRGRLRPVARLKRPPCGKVAIVLSLSLSIRFSLARKVL